MLKRTFFAGLLVIMASSALAIGSSSSSSDSSTTTQCSVNITVDSGYEPYNINFYSGSKFTGDEIAQYINRNMYYSYTCGTTAHTITADVTSIGHLGSYSSNTKHALDGTVRLKFPEDFAKVPTIE